MRLKQKLLSGYLVIVAAAILVSYVGIKQINSIKQSYFGLAEQTIPLIASLQNIKAASLQILAATSEYAFIINEHKLTGKAQPEEVIAEEIEEIRQSVSNLNKWLLNYEKLVDQYFHNETQFLKQIKISSAKLIETSQAIVDLKDQNHSTTYSFTLKEQLESHENLLLDTFDRAMKHERDELKERKEAVDNNIEYAANIMISISLVSLLLALASSYLIGRSVIEPVKLLNHASQEISNGNLNQRVEVKSNDEIGNLAKSFNDMANEMQTLYRDLEQKVKERTRQLELVHEELVKKERLATLGQVTAIVSHELRNPLGTIRSSLFTVGEKVRNKQLGVERALDRIERNISRCDNIIEELLDYTRHRNLKLAETDVDKWIKNIIDEMDLPSIIRINLKSDTTARIIIDSERLRRAVVNIINNAVEALTTSSAYSEEHSTEQITGEVEVTTNIKQDVLIISIHDSGPGISEEQKQKIFEPLHSTKSFGVGLGLPIAKQIVAQHQGEISIDSKPGKGTTIEIRIPVHSAKIIREVNDG